MDQVQATYNDFRRCGLYPGICRHIDNMPLFKQGMALSCSILSQGIVKLQRYPGSVGQPVFKPSPHLT